VRKVSYKNTSESLSIDFSLIDIKADSGKNQVVSVKESVVLDANNSVDENGLDLTYTWSILALPNESNVVLSNLNSVNPSFVPDKLGKYQFSVSASNGYMQSSSDVNISLVLPSANAGEDQTLIKLQEVQLDGGKSSDASRSDLSYAWSFNSKPTGSQATLKDDSVVDPKFTPDIVGLYTLELSVDNGYFTSVSDTVDINYGIVSPIAVGGSDQSISVPKLIQLDGSSSVDPAGFDLSYSWTFKSIPSGSSVVLSDSKIVNPTFTPDLEGDYVLNLAIDNGRISSSSEVTISLVKPLANAGNDQEIAKIELVQLDGNLSSDTSEQTLTYTWNFISIPKDSRVVLSDTSVVNPTFIPDLDGQYVVGLEVNNGTFVSVIDSVVIDVNFLLAVLQTGQIESFVAYDDGYLQEGIQRVYSRSNNSVVDTISTLQWQDDIEANSIQKNWSEAVAYCEALDLDGYTNWRMPSKKELQSLVDYSKDSPSINSNFLNTASQRYWSSVSSVENSSNAWYVHFIDGYSNHLSKTNSYYVRCVRAAL
jgi:hypothetical protein